MDNIEQNISGLDVARKVCGDKWKMLILTHLFRQDRQFGELLYCIDLISKKVLLENLREMEKLKLIRRVETVREGDKVTVYSLTSIGQMLKPMLHELALWSLEYTQYVKELS